MSGINRKIRRVAYVLKYEGFFALCSAVWKKLFGPKRDFGELQAEILSLPDAKDRFNKIYEHNIWGDEESLSGPGSSAKYTEKLRAELPGIIKEYGIRSIVDAPCGDFAWMKLLVPQIDVEYIGCDIVGSVIERNTKLFAAPGVTFMEKDISTEPLPDGDLIFVRDCLFHLSFADIDGFLHNLEKTNYKYLMTTAHRIENQDEFNNTDILTGDFRLIDLYSAPFGFDRDSVLVEIEDFLDGWFPRDMVMIARKDVPKALMARAADAG
mgnify:FL=1